MSREIEVFWVIWEKFGIFRFCACEKAKIIVLQDRRKKFLFNNINNSYTQTELGWNETPDDNHKLSIAYGEGSVIKLMGGED